MNNCKVSVLVMQYNPILENLKKTLVSILKQKNLCFEIVITDDGSKEDYFDELKTFFTDYLFENYVLVKNKDNKGTVRNTLSGLQKCNGKYIKCISPGDYLYNEYVLSKAYEELETKQAGLLFGRMAFYREGAGGLEFFHEQRPYALEVYKKGDTHQIRKHLLIYQDNISGASAFVRKDILIKLMQQVEGAVIFQEDVTFSMLTFMGEKLIYLDEYVVWYEYGAGVSTNGENKWTVRLKKDTYSYYDILDKLYGKERYVKRAVRFQQMEMKPGAFWKLMKNLLYPDRFIFRKKYVIGQQKISVLPDVKYYENIINESGRT